MKALTICQPWAWAIAHAGKRVENRTWPTRYRGPLAIHAGKSREYLDAEDPQAWPDAYNVAWPPEREFVFGAVVAVADLVACVELAKVAALDPKQAAWLAEHPFTEGPVCWILKNVRALLEPVPCRGGQGLWDLPAEIVRLIAH